MRLLRIAFTGAHGVGKDTLANFVADELINDDVLIEMLAHHGDEEVAQLKSYWTPQLRYTHIRVLGSSQRYVANLAGMDATSELPDDYIQLWGSVVRRLWEFEHQDRAVVISPRCGLDNLAYQAVKTQNLADSVQTTSLVGPDGQSNLVRHEDVRAIHLANCALQVLQGMAEEELENYWDFVYYKRPKERMLIEADGGRPTETEYQSAIDQTISNLLQGAPEGHPYHNIMPLPEDVGDAKEFLKTEVWKWKETVASARAR